MRDDYIEKDRSRGIYFTQDCAALPGVMPLKQNLKRWKFEENDLFQTQQFPYLKFTSCRPAADVPAADVPAPAMLAAEEPDVNVPAAMPPTVEAPPAVRLAAGVLGGRVI
jgi:hypothetical protein